MGERAGGAAERFAGLAFWLACCWRSLSERICTLYSLRAGRAEAQRLHSEERFDFGGTFLCVKIEVLLTS